MSRLREDSETHEPESREVASAKEKHEFLATILKETRYGLIDFMFKQAAILLLFLGWLVTSDKARSFIAGSSRVRVIAALVIGLYALLFAGWAYTWRVRSVNAFNHLTKLNYMPREFYEPLQIKLFLVIGFIAIHWAACAAAIMFVFLAAATQPIGARAKVSATCPPRRIAVIGGQCANIDNP